MKHHDLKSEYKLFQDAEAHKKVIPPDLEQGLMRRIHQDLQPSTRRVLGKFGLVHIFSSVLTLSICPQFGLGPFFGQHGIMRFFMYFGDLVCIALCGAFYLSSTVALAFSLMRAEEWRRLQELALAAFSGAASLSLLAFFVITQSGLVEELFWSASFILAWFVAAVAAAKSTGKLLNLASK